MINTYIAVDLETTGLNPKTDKIIEIGAVRVVDGQIAETFESLVNPHRRLNGTVRELTRITDEQLAEAPDINVVLKRFLDFAEENVLLGHRVLFDYSFLKKAAVDHNVVFERQGIDTLKLARKYLPQLESRTLPVLCQYYDIAYTPHRALADAKAAHLLYGKLVENFYNEEDFRASQLLYCAKKAAAASKRQKERLCKLIDKHKLIIDYDIDSLSKNEVSRYTDKILAEYGR